MDKKLNLNLYLALAEIIARETASDCISNKYTLIILHSNSCIKSYQIRTITSVNCDLS